MDESVSTSSAGTIAARTSARVSTGTTAATTLSDARRLRSATQCRFAQFFKDTAAACRTSRGAPDATVDACRRISAPPGSAIRLRSDASADARSAASGAYVPCSTETTWAASMVLRWGEVSLSVLRWTAGGRGERCVGRSAGAPAFVGWPRRHRRDSNSGGPRTAEPIAWFVGCKRAARARGGGVGNATEPAAPTTGRRGEPRGPPKPSIPGLGQM